MPTGEPLNLDYLKTKGHPYNVDWFKIETRSDTVINWALFVPKNQKLAVPTSWGDVLTANRSGVPHGLGDYLLCSDGGNMPNLSDMWIVNGAIFPSTYDMRAFPNMSSGEPNYELSRFEHKHPEFNGVTWNPIHSIASTAGKLHMENKGKSEMYTVQVVH